MAESVAFGLFQVLFSSIPGVVGLVAQNEPLAFVMLILTERHPHTGCAWASIACYCIAPRVFAFAARRRPRPHLQARPPARRLCGQTARRRRPVPAACWRLSRCWAWRYRPTTSLPGAHPA
ncbi:MAG: hypothetical protein V8Q95_07115 [Collinsella sp.]